MMGVDYHNCGICDTIFNDCGHFGICEGCDAWLCGPCYDEMYEKYGKVADEDDEDFEEELHHCDVCDGTVIDTTKFFEFLADKLGQSTEELEAEYRATLLNETEG